jgi:hypothetical protein
MDVGVIAREGFVQLKDFNFWRKIGTGACGSELRTLL